LLLQEESAFTGVASQCLSVLVLGINTHLDACLQVSLVITIVVRLVDEAPVHPNVWTRF
jgi:hypothetical protein